MSSRVNAVRAPDGRFTVALGSISTCDGSNEVMKVSTWLYPSAQNNLVAISTAPVLASGNWGASNCTNQVWPFASRAAKPGLVPADFSRSSVHRSGPGAAVELMPRASCSLVNGAVPARLTNQLESGTSSVVLTLPALVFEAFRSALTKRL